MNDFFQNSPALGENWQLVQQALQDQVRPFPDIVPDKNGNLLSSLGDGTWRLTQWISGEIPSAGDPLKAYQAGRTLGLHHLALNVPKPLPYLSELPKNFAFTNQNLARKEDFDNIYSQYRRHPNLGKLDPLIRRAAKASGNLPQRPIFQRVFLARDLVIHGDPKRENFLCLGDNMVLLDWDTVGYGDPLIDLGELCRSFAVVKPSSVFRMDLAVNAVRGYEASGFSFAGEIPLLLPTVIRALAINLTRRYLIDALAEIYFSWDEEHFESLFDQNEARAKALVDMVEEMEIREMEFCNLLAT
jgi:Ser/Thr protein kinase RdoA (MazF antagonist)